MNRNKVKGMDASIGGVAILTMAYLCFTVIGAVVSWQHPDMFLPHGMLLAFAALAVGFIICMFPEWAYLLGPVYALVEGFLIGAYSMLMEASYLGIVMQAVSCTFGIALSCSIVYGVTGYRPSDAVRRMVSVATLGVGCIYLLDLALGFFTGGYISFLHENTPLGIVVSLIIIVVATFSLYTDYDRVCQAIENGVDQSYEAYYAFGLTVTLLWLYLEVLRLLGKIRSRK